MVLANRTPTKRVRDAAAKREQPGSTLQDAATTCASLDEGAQAVLAVSVVGEEVAAHGGYWGFLLGLWVKTLELRLTVR